MSFNKRDIEFLYEVGSLRNVQRRWRQQLAVDCENDLEHTLRVVWLALILARKEGEEDEEKVMKMALVHDVAESRTIDFNYIHKLYAKADGQKAARDIFAGTSLEDFFLEVLNEYEARKSPAAKIVKDADNLEADLELRELEERGLKLPDKWRKSRKRVRDERLYTDSARQLWDELDKVDVSAWHLAASKWLDNPKAAR